MSLSLGLFMLVVLLAAYVIYVYNQCISMIEAVKNDSKQIDIQLDRRFKVFQSLVDVVKKYMDYEQSTLKDVVKLRNEAVSANQSGDQGKRMQSENAISGMLGNIKAVFEQYPDLKANQNAMQLQEEIVNTENQLTFAKQSYNDGVEKYEAFKKQFPAVLIVHAFASALNISFAYWQLSSDDAKQKEDYTVKL
jgi:LemA protein